jgi:hypothetical protein
MPNTLQIKRGLQVNLPTGIAGELLFTTDTKRVYIGDGATNNLLQGASSILTTGMVSFSDSSGKLTGSSSLYWDNTNGRLGIGTSSPSVRLGITYSDNNYLEGININNTNTGTQALSGLSFTTNAVIGGFMSYNPSNYILSSQRSTMLFTSVGNNKLAFIANSNSSGVAQDIYFSTLGTNSTYQMQIKGNTGNVQIGTTTDAGYKLDVNGTARVQDTLTLKATDGTALTAFGGAVTLTQGGGGRLLNFVNGGIFFNNTYTFAISNGVATPFSALGTDVWFGNANQNVNSILLQRNSVNDYTIIKSQGGLSSINYFDIRTGDYTSSAYGAISSGNIRLYSGDNTGTGGGGFGNLILQHNGTVKRGNVLIGTSTNVASAIVNVQSTTQGFLFPRMTTTEKNAIASPATGLMVYDTTLNKLCVRTASAWETITSL